MLIGWLALACNGSFQIPSEPTGADPDVTDPPSEVVPPVADALEPPIALGVESCDPLVVDGRTVDCQAAWEAWPDALDDRLLCCACDAAWCDVCDPSRFGDARWPPAAPPPLPPPTSGIRSSCMTCHNGVEDGDPLYSGPGLENPHFFGSAAYLECTSCHGGDGTPGASAAEAHVPPPPGLTDHDARTLAGVDLLPDWTANGTTYTALDWLQFRNPGDLRVVAAQRSCGTSSCHGDEHGAWVDASPMGTNVGVFSVTRFGMGLWHADGTFDFAGTASDTAHRARFDPDFAAIGGAAGWVGRVESLQGIPETGALADDVHAGVVAGDLLADIVADRVRDGSTLEDLVMVGLGNGCGDCHLGSAGPNDGYARFRSGGCSACHMPMEADGRARSRDLQREDPLVGRPHVARHRIRSVARNTFGRGEDCESVELGIDDTTCASCHVGSNATALQYWGIRVDPERDVVGGTQYPANPVAFRTAADDTRLFDPAAGNATYAGYTADQLLLEEDYDGDGRDDTPPDVHFAAGMACIDCHGSFDVHGGTEGGPVLGLVSQQHQATSVRCESCHGDVDARPTLLACVTYDGQAGECVIDRFGNPLRNVVRVEVGGQSYLQLRGRVSGRMHWVPEVLDLIDATSGRTHPDTGAALYSEAAAFAMGRVGTTGGPVQDDPTLASPGFAHGDALTCSACHAAWTNARFVERVAVAYDPDGARPSSTTGAPMALATTVEHGYRSPVVRQLGIGVDGRVEAVQPGPATVFRYTDAAGDRSPGIATGDRTGLGHRDTTLGANAYPALVQHPIAPHTTRGAETATAEGVLGCPACHLTAAMLDEDGVANPLALDYARYRALYLDGNQFVAMATPGDVQPSLYDVLVDAIGRNPGNAAEHPIAVAMHAGLGTGLFLVDANGCPVNPLDARPDRPGCEGTAVDRFTDGTMVYDLDRVVERTGVENTGPTRPMAFGVAAIRRDGADDPLRAGPLGATLIERLTDPEVGLVLDRW
jgi:hypothetical protein